MRLSPRSSDDADVIRARLRVLLAERDRSGGWLPDDLDDLEEAVAPSVRQPDDTTTTYPVPGDEDADQRVGLPHGLGRHRAPDHAQRWDPGRYGARSLWAVGLAAALILVGWTWLDRPRVETAPASRAAPVSSIAPGTGTPPVGEAAQTSATVVVSVVGLVARPGLVTVVTGARVADAVEAAGGLLPEADPASVNLAAVVADGEQVAIGAPGAVIAGGPRPGPAGAGAGAAGPVDLNTAGVAELDALPGIGPVLAQRIVDHRTQAGGFRRVEELDDVPGIGPTTAAELAELVRV